MNGYIECRVVSNEYGSSYLFDLGISKITHSKIYNFGFIALCTSSISSWVNKWMPRKENHPYLNSTICYTYIAIFNIDGDRKSTINERFKSPDYQLMDSRIFWKFWKKCSAFLLSSESANLLLSIELKEQLE